MTSKYILYYKKNKYICILFILLIIIRFYEPKKIKVCICTIGKLENLYVREYIYHYLNYGVDKIFIYDNNDINGERFEYVINDFISKEFIEIINCRGKLRYQQKAYQECLNKNYNKFNWLLFYDMDEFIYLYNYKSIKSYLNQRKFTKCQTIQLNMFFHTDNNLLYYQNHSLSERFIDKIKRPIETLKSIIKGNIKIKVNCVHNINDHLKSCNGFGSFNNKEKIKIFTRKPDFKFYYIDHFCFKSTQEYINKLNKGSAIYGKGNDIKMKKIGWYFDINKITSHKITFFENNTNLNLSIYRDKISKK